MKLNKKGFTLVELLAVIVVLAVIMVIAIPTVIDSMNSAKKSAFVMYGQKMITAAMSKAQGDALDGNPVQSAYSFKDLAKSTGQYTGYVEVNGDDYTVSFYNSDYAASARSYDQLEAWKKATCNEEQLNQDCSAVAPAGNKNYQSTTAEDKTLYSQKVTEIDSYIENNKLTK